MSHQLDKLNLIKVSKQLKTHIFATRGFSSLLLKMLGGTCNERTFNEILMILQIQSSHTILKLPEKLFSRERVGNKKYPAFVSEVKRLKSQMLSDNCPCSVKLERLHFLFVFSVTRQSSRNDYPSKNELKSIFQTSD